MNGKLDLSNVRIYSNTKDDVKDAINLIGEKVYFSDFKDFETHIEGNLVRVSYTNDISHPFLGGNAVGLFKYFILAKDAKFMNDEEKKPRSFKAVEEFCKETILKEYEETIQKRSELTMLLHNFDSNTEFSRQSFEFLWLLRENLCQNEKILKTIAENEKIYEIYEIQRKLFDILTASTEG